MNIAMIGISSFVIALSGALMPGPLLTITVSESFKRGFKAGPLVILGHGMLELAVVLLVVLGVTPYLQTDSVRSVVGIAGGLVMVLMGAMTMRDARSASIDLSAQRTWRGMHPVLAGLLGSLSNPYWVIWWITIGLGYLLSAFRFGVNGVLVFFTGHIAADLIWYSLVSYAVSRGRRIMGDRGYRAVLMVCGIALAGFGAWFFIAALR